MSKYSTLHRGVIVAALDRFLLNSGDQSVAFDEDYHLHLLDMFGIPFREVTPIAWHSGGCCVAGVNELADILRQSGMRTFRRIYAVGVTPGSIPRSGEGCAIIDFSADGLVVHFSPDRNAEPVEMPLGDAIDAVVDLFRSRFGEVEA